MYEEKPKTYGSANYKRNYEEITDKILKTSDIFNRNKKHKHQSDDIEKY